MAYSKVQLELLWGVTNPGNGDPHLMAAIALAESAGDPASVNSIGACGLWQIHPYEAGCLNASTNARMAGEKLRTQGLGAWETYTNGSYRQFMGGTSTSPAGTGSTRDVLFGIPGTPGSSLEPGGVLGEHLGLGKEGSSSLTNPFNALGMLGKIPSDFDKIYKLFFTPEGWIRVGKVLLGVFLLMTGVLGMANVSGTDLAVGTGNKALDVVELAAKSPVK